MQLIKIKCPGYFLSIILAGYLLSACTNNSKKNELPYYNTPDFTPHWYGGNKDSISKAHTISEFICTDQNGKKFGTENLKGKISLANFFFTTCGSMCPKMTFNLKFVQDSFHMKKDVQIVSFSVMPWQDSFPVLQEYELDNGINNQFWHLLTGNKNDIYTVARRSFFAEKEAGFDKSSNEFLHTEHILLIDKNLHIRGVYNGTESAEIPRITGDIKLLLKE